MYDALMDAVARAQTHAAILERLGLSARGYLLATVHRPENTDSLERLQNILAAFGELDETVVFPVHPRTRRVLERTPFNLKSPNSNLKLIEPLGYLDMARLTQSARMLLTDSGGMQKEAYWLGVPCVTMRDQTEWVETVAAGWNLVVGGDRKRIVNAVRAWKPPALRLPLYGDGTTASRIAQIL